MSYKFQLRDKHCPELRRQARAVSFVLNLCNEIAQRLRESKLPKAIHAKIRSRRKNFGVNAATKILRAGQRTLVGGAHAA